MTIEFEIVNNELILCYFPMIGIKDILNRISKEEEVRIKNTFFVTKQLLRNSDKEDFEDSLRFCIGVVIDEYIQINSLIIGTSHTFYFSKDIKLKAEMFVAYRNISILRKIDEIIDTDFYIGGNWEFKGGITKETFTELLKKFPKSSELDKYTHYRIANIIKECFPECDKYEGIYNQFIRTKSKLAKSSYNSRESKSNIKIELAQFTTAFKLLQDMLVAPEGIEEAIWQEKIQYILQFLYPKYILCTREMSFKGIDGYDKRPDFILVDTNGFVDILEIKKPDVRVLTKQASYRNNYVPVREFSGAIQQIEKYIFCLTSIEKNQKDVLSKLKKLLPDGVEPQIVNPQGMLLLGRSNDFNQQQKRDFELIKRQYKNVADIMTYDDLSTRIKNIINALKLKLD